MRPRQGRFRRAAVSRRAGVERISGALRLGLALQPVHEVGPLRHQLSRERVSDDLREGVLHDPGVIRNLPRPKLSFVIEIEVVDAHASHQPVQVVGASGRQQASGDGFGPRRLGYVPGAGWPNHAATLLVLALARRRARRLLSSGRESPPRRTLDPAERDDGQGGDRAAARPHPACGTRRHPWSRAHARGHVGPVDSRTR